MKKKVYEVAACVKYAINIRASSRAEALKHVESWRDAWHTSATLIGVDDVGIADVKAPGFDADEEAD